MRRAATAGAAAVLALGTLTACGSGGSGSTTNVTLHVFAAASLTESFTSLGKTFEQKHPGTKVVFDFGPSSGLAEQI
ncbi:MAG: extracellular solute-binding protein, partial [Marmoricola sp.]|nr:extracellular solute-binding protein [Marmoricola sp.]